MNPIPSVFSSNTIETSAQAAVVAGLGREAPLPYAFDAVLTVAPSIRSVSADPQCERLAHSLDLMQTGVVFRSIRLTTGRCVSVVAVPSVCWRDPVLHACVLDLKWAVELSGRRLYDANYDVRLMTTEMAGLV